MNYKHLKIVHPYFRYMCPFCKEKYRLAYTCIFHIEKQHRNQLKDESEEISIPE